MFPDWHFCCSGRFFDPPFGACVAVQEVTIIGVSLPRSGRMPAGWLPSWLPQDRRWCRRISPGRYAM
jgi:hypothetical protein